MPNGFSAQRRREKAVGVVAAVTSAHKALPLPSPARRAVPLPYPHVPCAARSSGRDKTFGRSEHIITEKNHCPILHFLEYN